MSDLIVQSPGTSLPAIRRDISGASTDEQLISLWLAGCRSAHTRRLYERAALRLLRTLPHGIGGATVGDVIRFEESMAAMAPKARHTMMAAIRALFRFADRVGYIVKSPAHVRPNRRPPTSMRERCLAREEVWALIDHAGGLRNAVMLRFLYGTGCRVSELCWLHWRNAFWLGVGDERVLTVTVLGKREMYRDVPIPAWVGLGRPVGATDDDAIFTVDENAARPWPAISAQTVRHIVREAARRAGVRKPVSPHWFRHSACTHLQEDGIPPILVKELLGHASLDTTTGYSHGTFRGAPGDVLARGKHQEITP